RRARLAGAGPAPGPGPSGVGVPRGPARHRRAALPRVGARSGGRAAARFRGLRGRGVQVPGGTRVREIADSDAAGYFDAAATDAAAPALAERTKPVLDDLLPGANASAARVLLRLARVTGEAQYRRRAEATLATFTG